MMKRVLRFHILFIVVVFLALAVIVQADKKMDSNIQMECLPSDEEFSSFHCLNLPAIALACINTNPSCENWASRDECTRNPQYMLLHCRQACNSCISLHHGGVTQVAFQQPQDVLHKLIEIQRYLHQLADDSGVEHLKTCVNKHELCTEWTLAKECESNPIFMKTECALACQMC
jgi:hypothetical protein